MSEFIDPPMEQRLRHLLSHLGFREAHFAGWLARDWLGVVTTAPDIVTSLTVVGSAPVEPDLLGGLASRLLVVNGDRGPIADRWRAITGKLPQARIVHLSDYALFPWTDVVAERTDDVGAAMIELLDKTDTRRADAPSLPASSGEVAGMTYRILGNGPALVLMPLFFAPSQWEPLLPRLAERYTTIVLGGPEVGAVGVLEWRGRAAGYRQMLRSVIDETRLAPNDSVLEVGSGSGAVSRWLAHHTRGANRIVGVDVNPYLLGEASALARRDGVNDVVEFREGNAEGLPFGDAIFDLTWSVTVIEEVDAPRMLADMVRVTKPGGRVAVVARAMDVPLLMNVSVSSALKAKLEAPGFMGVVGAHGCADASLYRRFRAAGLTQLTAFPHWTAFSAGDRHVVDFLEAGFLGKLEPQEAAEWKRARAEAEVDGTFFMTWPHHCAIGTKA
jgi:SAM-dependent methyltransferase